jgi:hypothetical protein
LIPDRDPAKVRWSSYKENIDAWQGALEHKGTYAKHFYKQTSDSLRNGGYDTTKLEAVLDAVIAQARRLQEPRFA